MSHRMRPFKELASREQALEALLDAAVPVKDVEDVPVSDAGGRVLAADVDAPVDVPAFDRSAMDGYAVRAEDTFGAGRLSPKPLAVVGVLHAGETTDRVLGKGEAIQIATGSPLPPGADAVVRVEDTKRTDDRVDVHAGVPPGQNVSRRGSDMAEGKPVLEDGSELTPARVGLLASIGRTTVPVYRRPRVLVVPTGAEVVEPGDALGDGQVYNSNAYALEALFREAGADVTRVTVVPDTLDAIEGVIDGPGAHADLITFTGGSSVGERDILVDVVRKRGELLVHGVQVKPGKPLLVGKLDARVVVGLPGYPTSCVTNAYAFCVPTIHRIARRPPGTKRLVTAVMGESYPSRLGRYQILPVQVLHGRAYSTFKESGALTSVAASDGWIGIPDNVESVEEGETVTVHLW